MRAAVALVALGLAFGVTACGSVEPELRTSRLHFTAPKAGADVTLPVTLSWTGGPAATNWAVFVDRDPVPPGARVPAAVTTGPPNGVFRATAPTITLHEGVRPDGGSTVRYRVTVVPVEDGRRLGEAFATVTFFSRVTTTSAAT